MDIMTPAEWLEVGMPDHHTLWTHGLDLVKHCLQGDVDQTFFKDQNPSMSRFKEWEEGMQERRDPQPEFDELVDNAYKPVKKWQAYAWESGDLQVDDFIAAEEMPFQAWERRLSQQPALSIILDTFVPWSERDYTYMVDFHKRVYTLIAQCESEQRPCRVVSAYGSASPEDGLSHTNPLKLFTVIKDYDDPIFPAIWGTYVNNLYTNAFVNVVADFFIGLHDIANGYYRTIPDIKRYFPEDEELVFLKRPGT